MSAKVMKSKTGVFAALKDIFFGGEVTNYDDVILPPELKNTLKGLAVREAEVERGITPPKNGGKRNTGFAKPIINPKIEAAMRKKAEGVSKENGVNKKIDREIVD